MEIIIPPHTFQETIINPRALPYSNPGQRNDLIRNPRGSLQISVCPFPLVKRNFAGKQSSTEMKLRYRININGGGQWISRCKCRECRCSRSCERTTIGIVFSFPTTTTSDYWSIHPQHLQAPTDIWWWWWWWVGLHSLSWSSSSSPWLMAGMVLHKDSQSVRLLGTKSCASAAAAAWWMWWPTLSANFNPIS